MTELADGMGRSPAPAVPAAMPEYTSRVSRSWINQADQDLSPDPVPLAYGAVERKLSIQMVDFG